MEIIDYLIRLPQTSFISTVNYDMWSEWPVVAYQPTELITFCWNFCIIIYNMINKIWGLIDNFIYMNLSQ